MPIDAENAESKQVDQKSEGWVTCAHLLFTCEKLNNCNTLKYLFSISPLKFKRNGCMLINDLNTTI